MNNPLGHVSDRTAGRSAVETHPCTHVFISFSCIHVNILILTYSLYRLCDILKLVYSRGYICSIWDMYAMVLCFRSMRMKFEPYIYMHACLHFKMCLYKFTFEGIDFNQKSLTRVCAK